MVTHHPTQLGASIPKAPGNVAKSRRCRDVQETSEPRKRFRPPAELFGGASRSRGRQSSSPGWLEVAWKANGLQSGNKSSSQQASKKPVCPQGTLLASSRSTRWFSCRGLVWWHLPLKQGHKRSFQTKSRPSSVSPCRDVRAGCWDIVTSFSSKFPSRGICWDHPLPTNKLVCGKRTPVRPGSTTGTSLPRAVSLWHPSMMP